MVWFFAGLVVFGLVIGGLTGMSKSHVVSAVLPLLFTFAGGSVVTLSMAEGRTPEDLALLGQQSWSLLGLAQPWVSFSEFG